MTNSFFTQKINFFDRWAPFYDFLLTTVFYQAIHQRILDYVQFSQSAMVLDLGCGTGKLLNRLAQNFPQLQGVGVDLSPGMLRQARAENRHHPRLIFCEGNAESLPFADTQFDAVFNTISFLHYPDPQQVFVEVARILAPQGYFYLADYVGTGTNQKFPLSPGGLRFYSAQQREALGNNAGLRCLGHHYLLGSVMLSIFQRSRS
ncbi:MAG: class I SAM-dependent methyltransferase [Snowella sp.]|nr:class I SAM-dependent methyltransferase [Snowella sp.]